MAIQTDASFTGFVASDPQLSYTEKGDARLYMKAGREHFRKEPDGTFTQLENTFHDLVAFRGAADKGSEQLRKGDRFIASGYVREYTYKDASGQAVPGEEFVARHLGHDLARTRYEVDRTPRRQAVTRETPTREATAFASPERPTNAQPAPAIGM